MAEEILAVPRRGAAAIALLAVAGLMLSAWLAWLHLRVHGDPRYLPVCAVSETVNCATVAASPLAVLLGVPIAFWGMAGFGLVLALATRGLGRRRGPGDGAGFIALAAVGFVAVCAILAMVSVAFIGAVCPDCVAVYAVCLALAVVAVIRARRRNGIGKALGDDLAALRRAPVAGLIPWIACLAALVVLQATLPAYWTLPDRHAPLTFEGFDEPGRPWLGSADPSLVVHEFTDYECPHCRKAHWHLRRALAADPVRLRIVRHDYARMPCAPNDPVRQHSSCALARAGICAADQGRFWDWNDAVYRRPRPLGGKARESYVADTARDLGLDLELLEACLFAPATVERAQAVFLGARLARISDTPSYLVDGRRLTLAEVLEKVSKHR